MDLTSLDSVGIAGRASPRATSVKKNPLVEVGHACAAEWAEEGSLDTVQPSWLVGGPEARGQHGCWSGHLNLTLVCTGLVPLLQDSLYFYIFI